MKLYNSLTKQKETFEPISQDHVGVYTCGPTVYSFVTIGNWRTYVLGDVAIRALKYLGYDVDYVMNITDVGHLTGDNLGDADTGEDRLEKAAQKEGKTAWDIAEFYTQDFLKGFDLLNLEHPKVFAKATDHIQEQIDLVQQIEKAGFAYQIDDGIYFDVQAYEASGHTYGQLSNIDQVKEGARVEANPQKKDPRDFALWKFSHSKGRSFDSTQDDSETQRQMEWDSPWGVGFPGWHAECSAMSMKYLGSQFDIHLGGEDLKSTHHPNEIAQSEAATRKEPFVKYWMHGAFLQVNGGRMGKSLGNAYTIQDIVERGFDPLALRYFYFTGHYRKPLNFTWESLEAAQKTLDRLKQSVLQIKTQVSDKDQNQSSQDYSKQLQESLEDDLNLPEFLAVVWSLLKDSQLSAAKKLDLVYQADQILGFDLETLKDEELEIPQNLKDLLDHRQQAKNDKDFATADSIREQIQSLGFEIEDTSDGPKLKKVET